MGYVNDTNYEVRVHLTTLMGDGKPKSYVKCSLRHPLHATNVVMNSGKPETLESHLIV